MATIIENKTLRIKRLVLGPYSTNAYIVVCGKTNSSALIDGPAEPGMILKELEGTKPTYILLTHNHPDHIGALAEMRDALKVPLAAHELDSGRLPVTPDILLKDGDTFPVGKLDFTVLHTPGHTPGSLCFKTGRYLLSGDTIFKDGPGHTRTPDDFKQIVASLTGMVFVLPGNTLIFPGHGNSTTLKKEREEFDIFSSRSHKPDLCGDVVWLTS